MKMKLETSMTPELDINMSSERQRAYLDAMDIPVWCLREPVISESASVENPVGLKLAPGNDGVLLICAEDSDSAGRLANDINRILGGAPVWVWPYAADSAMTLTLAVQENLFTTVAFFGRELALQFFDGEIPTHLNSAKLVVLPSMQDIQTQVDARRSLWATFCRSGILDAG